MINGVSDKINTINKECENRDDQVPFENSRTKVLLKKIVALNTAIIPFPKIEAATECSVWAGNLVSLLNKHLIAVTSDTAVNWCFGLKKAAKCVDDYKTGIPKKVQQEIKLKKPSAHILHRDQLLTSGNLHCADSPIIKSIFTDYFCVTALPSKVTMVCAYNRPFTAAPEFTTIAVLQRIVP